MHLHGIYSGRSASPAPASACGLSFYKRLPPPQGRGQCSNIHKICPYFLFLHCNQTATVLLLHQCSFSAARGIVLFFYRRFFMRLRTRVLSFVLASSMMLSATPVSVFAETPVLGEGTVSPTALSETNSADGVYDSRVDGSHELRCTGGIFNDTINDAIYVVNQNSAPAAKLNFTPPDGHSIVAWRIDMGTAWGYNDATKPDVQMLLRAANLKCSADNTELTFTCPGSITYGEKTHPAFVADASLTPVLDITAADLLFEKGTVVLGNELSSGSGITATLVYYSVTDGVKGSEAMTTRPTKPGQYQIAVRLSVQDAGDNKYLNRVKCGNVYYQVDPSQELTSDAWRYRTVSSSVNLTVDENGEPVVPSGTAGVKYADGVLTIYPKFVVHFGVNDIVKCDIVNEGKLDGGIFTGTVTNKGVIESGMFVNKPENANSVKFSFTSGTTFCGLKDPSGTTSLYIVCTGKGSYPQPAASYSNPSRKPFGWLVAVTSPSFKGTSYGPMTADWTMVSPISTALSEQLYDAVAAYTPIAYMDSSDLSIDSTGKVNISIPEVEATGVTYTNTATKETFTSYPTVAGDYVAKVSLKCNRDWNSLASKDPVIPASALLADDGVAALSEEQENLIYRVALKGDLYYFVPKTLDVKVTVEQSAPASSVVNLTVDENGAPVIPADAKGVHYEGNTLTIDANTTARFAPDSAVKCDIVNNGTLDGGLFTGTVTNNGVIESGLFVNKPENAASAKFSFTSGAAFCGLKDSSGITSLYAVRTENGQNLHLTASYSNPNRDPFGWVQAIDIPNTTESAYLLYKNPNQNPWTVDVWADSALSKEETDVATIFTPVACMNSSDLSIDSTGTVDISIPEVEATGVTYTNTATKETFTSYPTVAGDYVAKVSLKCNRDWNSLASKDPVIPASALLADDGVAALSEEQENLIYRVALKGDLYYFVPKTLDVKVTVEQSAPASSVVNLTVDENGAPVIPADAKGVHYENNTLTIDANTTAQFAQGSTVKCDIVNNGTLDGGLFTGTVTGSGSIARGLFLNKPEAALTTMMLSVPENASLNGFTKPDASGLTTLYAVNTLDGEGYPLLFIGDYIGTDPHTFYGWDLVYSLGGEEKNSGVDYIGQTHFEQPLYGPIPDGQNGVNCTFLPVLEMDASDLTITADKTESKIDGAVIDSVKYVDASDPNAAPSTVYPTKAGSYKAIVTLTCPGDTTYSKARVARTGHLCYHVPETLEVPFEVKFQPELSIVNGLPDTTGMEADAEGVYTSKNWSYNKNTNTLSVTNSSYFETFTGLVSCKVVAGEGVKISNGYFMDTVTFDGGTVDGGWFVQKPEGCAPSDVHSIAYADGTTEFTVNKTLTVAKIWYGGTLDINISTETPIYSVSDKYLPHQTTSLTYRTQYPRDYVLNSLPAPALSTFTLSGVTDAYVMLDTTYRLDMTDPQELHEGVKVTVKADACDADHQVEWVAEGLELSEEQKHSAELTFTMPGNAVTLTATYPSTQPVQPELPELPDTDGNGNVVIPEGTTEVKGDGWTATKDDEGKTTVTITDSKNLNDTTLNCDKITISSNTTVSNLTTNAEVTVASGSTIQGGTFSRDVSVEADGTIASGTFSGDVSGTGTIEGGTFSGNVGSEVKINGGTFTGKVDSTNITGGVFAGEIPATVTSTKVTATGGASINNIQKNEGADQETAVQVVGEQKLSLAYTPDGDHTFYGWQKDAEIIKKGEDTNNTNVTVGSNNPAPVYTPVVKLIRSDLNDFDLMEVAGTEGYYQVVDGELTGDCLGNELPTEPGTYALGVKLMTAEPTENTIALALYADETASVGNSVRMKDGVGYYVPEVLQVGDSIPVGGSDAATGSGDSGAGGAAVAVIGGAAIGGAAYLIGTQVYLTSVLPEGASIPTNRQQLADLLWTAAGKPQPASTALFTDISADSQKAARWCVEQGLLKDTGSTFKPDKHTFRPQVIKAWNDLQAKLNPQK